MRKNLRRTRDCGLTPAPPKRSVLDLGCGVGWFLLVARAMGHDVRGLDREGDPIYREMTLLLGIPRTIHMIKLYQPLPAEIQGYDLVSAHMTSFNHYLDGRYWGAEEWTFFLNDLKSRLNPGATICLELNPRSDGTPIAEDFEGMVPGAGCACDFWPHTVSAASKVAIPLSFRAAPRQGARPQHDEVSVCDCHLMFDGTPRGLFIHLPQLSGRFNGYALRVAFGRPQPQPTTLNFFMANFGINGFGRIGRNVLRAMSQEQVTQIRAINDLTDTHTLAHLLKWDSVHGKFDGEIGYDDENIIVRGHKIKVLKERDPAKLPWKDLGVDVVLESTGFFTSRDKGASFISPVAPSKVLISAPAKNPDATICIGINDEHLRSRRNTTSSPTRAARPTASRHWPRCLHENFTIVNGFMSTIHSYTNDQRILDLPHEDLRRARAAALSIIPSSTGAAKAIGEVLPALKGKLNGGAFRVPTPDGSVTDFTAILEKEASVESINAAFKKAASDPSYKGVLEYSDEPLVSQDIVGNPHSCIFDSTLTMVHGGKFVKVVGWYDNEWGYSNRCVEMLERLAQ